MGDFVMPAVSLRVLRLSAMCEPVSGRSVICFDDFTATPLHTRAGPS